MSEVIKILLVEDDEDDYFLTSDYLEQCESPKFELTWVTNSLDAVEALKTEDFDLCLLDYLLGAENAIDACFASPWFSLRLCALGWSLMVRSSGPDPRRTGRDRGTGRRDARG